VTIDCDVHQGNGTAAIFADDPSVFTFSIHGAKNFPFRKETSDYDVGLADGVDDAVYLDELRQALPQVLRMARADLAIYLAGADPYFDDQFGRMKLTKQGLAERDRFVLESCRAIGLPVAITMAGGYSKRVEDTVDIHFRTVEIAVELNRKH
jgi:acetoin utilization deacetylase AcuC-like enzyme